MSESLEKNWRARPNTNVKMMIRNLELRKRASELRKANDKKYTKKELNIMTRADKFKKPMSLQFKLSQSNICNKG